MNNAIFLGTFDPVTKGIDIAEEGLQYSTMSQ